MIHANQFTSRHMGPAIVVVAISLLAAASASGETQYTATINGAMAGTASSAVGTASLTLNTAETELSYIIEYGALDGDETVAHFHNAAPGVNGPVIEPLPAGSPKVGTWAVGIFEVGELNAGRIYINIHSTLYPGGEIRGNVESTTVANDGVAWGSIKALYQ